MITDVRLAGHDDVWETTVRKMTTEEKADAFDAAAAELARVDKARWDANAARAETAQRARLGIFAALYGGILLGFAFRLVKEIST